MRVVFDSPAGKSDLEEGDRLTPRFGPDGLVTCVVTQVDTGEVLMVAHMNRESLAHSIETGEAWYWSRSRGELWHKGATSGQIQTIEEIARRLRSGRGVDQGQGRGRRRLLPHRPAQLLLPQRSAEGGARREPPPGGSRRLNDPDRTIHASFMA